MPKIAPPAARTAAPNLLSASAKLVMSGTPQLLRPMPKGPPFPRQAHFRRAYARQWRCTNVLSIVREIQGAGVTGCG